MPAEHTYDYAIIRVVPRVERGERINVGVILSCPALDFLDARIELDAARARARSIPRRRGSARGAPRVIPAVLPRWARRRPVGALPQRARFRWLVSPRSTVIQVSPVHTGRTADPASTLERLLDTMVRTGSSSADAADRTSPEEHT